MMVRAIGDVVARPKGGTLEYRSAWHHASKPKGLYLKAKPFLLLEAVIHGQLYMRELLNHWVRVGFVLYNAVKGATSVVPPTLLYVFDTCLCIEVVCQDWSVRYSKSSKFCEVADRCDVVSRRARREVRGGPRRVAQSGEAKH